MQRLLDKMHEQLPVLSKSLGRTLVEAVCQQDYREADHILQLTTYMFKEILRPKEMKIIILDILRTVMESYQKTKWEDREYMKNALTVTHGLLEKYRELFQEDKAPYASIDEFVNNIQIITRLIDIILDNKDDTY